MNLAIFDIDGTLTATNEIDDVCFVQAMADAHQIAGISTDWAGYRHTTDSGIIEQIFEERLGRKPADAELVKFKSRFVSLLNDNCAENSSLFAEVDGAAQAFVRLSREPEWAVAIATGCWRDSAVLKLKAANINYADVPGGFAEDGLSREEILRAAITKAQKIYRQGSFAKTVSIGDGLWDVRAARNLGLPFLGIGAGERAEGLRRAGAVAVLENYADYARLLRCLEEAEIPEREHAN
jgi:phosphoglycolate phosphatase-like HAD superfamily hydrolase